MECGRRSSRRRGAPEGWPGAAGAVAVFAGAIGIIVVGVGPTPPAALLVTQALGPRTFVAALAMAAGTSLIGCAGYVWAMRGVAFEQPG